MGDVCPDCGAKTTFVEQSVRVVRGNCAACGGTFTVLRQPTPTGGAAGADEGADAGGAVAVAPATGPACGVCGTPMSLRSTSESALEAQCPSCEATFSYVLATAPGSAPPPERFAPARRGRPPERGRFAGPSARPCRECGGPLSFSTDESGNVTGECGSCGNRFTLPPRREFRRDGDDRGDRGGGGRPFPPRFRRTGPWTGRRTGDRPSSYSNRGGGYRPRDRRRDDDGDDDDAARRRRRPRRE